MITHGRRPAAIALLSIAPRRLLRGLTRSLLAVVLWPVLVGSVLPRFAGSSVRPLRFTVHDPSWYEAELLALLVAAKRRLYVYRSLVLLARALLLVFAILALSRVLEIFGPLVSPQLVAAASIVALTGVAIIILYQRISFSDVARILDRQAGTSERLATAVELIAQRDSHPLARRQVQDATVRLRALGGRMPLAFHVPWSDLKAAGGMAVVVALAMAISFVQLNVFTPAVDPDEIAMAVEDPLMGEFPTDGGEYPEMALADQDLEGDLGGTLSDLRAELEGLNLTEEEIQSRLADVQMLMQQRAEALQRQRQALGELSNALQDNSSTADAAADLRRGDYEAASQKLSQLGTQTDQLSARSRRDLAEQLMDAANRVQPNNPELANRMRRAAQALARDDPQAVQQAMSELGEGIKQAGEQMQSESGSEMGEMASASDAGMAPGEDDLSELEFSGSMQGGDPGDMEPLFGEDSSQGEFGVTGSEEGGPGDPGSQGQAGAQGEATGSESDGGGGGSGAGSGEGSQAGRTGRASVQDGKLLQLRGRPGDGPSSVAPDNERVSIVSSTDNTVGGISASGAAGVAIDPTNIRTESNFVPWDKRQIVRDYFTGSR